VKAVRSDPGSFATQYAPSLGLPAPVVERGLRQTLWDLPTAEETRRLYQQYLELTGDTRPVADDFFFLP
jgi:hypothetical protein